MKYLVLKSESSIKFFDLYGAGDGVVLNGESNATFYVREYVAEISGVITVNQITNYAKGGTLIVMTHSGCNIRVDGELLPQGACEMTMGKKYVTGNVTLFLINEDEKTDVQDAFNTEIEMNYFNGHDDDFYNDNNAAEFLYGGDEGCEVDNFWSDEEDI